MKIVHIDNEPFPALKSENYQPTFDLTVEMSQEEYNHICYLLEKDSRETREMLETYRKVKEIKTR